MILTTAALQEQAKKAGGDQYAGFGPVSADEAYPPYTAGHAHILGHIKGRRGNTYQTTKKAPA